MMSSWIRSMASTTAIFFISSVRSPVRVCRVFTPRAIRTASSSANSTRLPPSMEASTSSTGSALARSSRAL